MMGRHDDDKARLENGLLFAGGIMNKKIKSKNAKEYDAIIKKQKIEIIQKRAKDNGHCLCNRELKCPCPVYITSNYCRCYEDSTEL